MDELIGKEVTLTYPISGNRVVLIKDISKHPRTGTICYKVSIPGWHFDVLLSPKGPLRIATIEETVASRNRSAETINQNFTKKKPPSIKGKNDCLCGCGGKTNGKFVPGHDMKAKSLLRKVIAGEKQREEISESLLLYVSTNPKWREWFGEIL